MEGRCWGPCTLHDKNKPRHNFCNCVGVLLPFAQGSIYAALAKVAPYDAREEEARRDAQFNYYPSSE